jgi:hypothetical protein
MFARAQVLLTELPPPLTKFLSNQLPAHNHLLAAHSAMCLDSLPKMDLAKTQILLLQRTLNHTSKHILHKYKRSSTPTKRFQVYAITNYTARESAWVKYLDYPPIHDLEALKREILALTEFPKIKSPDLDSALFNLSDLAFNERRAPSYDEFLELMKQVEEYWTLLIDFVLAQRSREVE